MRPKTRTTKLLLAGALAALLSGGGALAYLTSVGGGSGAAQVGSASDLTISPGAPTAQLYPGGSGDVVAVISNPNPFAAHVNSLELDTSHGSGGFASTGGSGTCNDPDLSFAAQDNGGAGWSVPPRVGAVDGTRSVTLPGAISMGAGADDGCQGATFTVYLRTGL